MSVECSNCGHLNPPEALSCEKCGTSLRQPQVTGNPISTGKKEWFPKYYGTNRDKTILGLFLFAAGLLIAWIPYANYAAGILELVGLILIYFGKKGFRSSHIRNVNIAIWLFAITVIALVISSIIFTAYLFQLTLFQGGFGSSIESSTVNLFYTFLEIVVVIAVITGISNVLLAYDPASKFTRILLVSAFLASVIISLFNWFTTGRFFASELSAVVSNHLPSNQVINAINSRIAIYRYLQVIPDAIMGIAYLMVRDRIISGTVPTVGN